MYPFKSRLIHDTLNVSPTKIIKVTSDVIFRRAIKIASDENIVASYNNTFYNVQQKIVKLKLHPIRDILKTRGLGEPV